MEKPPLNDNLVTEQEVLPDVLSSELSVVFCGTAVGIKSRNVGAYYASHNNSFWETLAAVGFTPVLLRPTDYSAMSAYGLGLTDLAKNAAGIDNALSKRDFDRNGLREKILRYQPRVLAFVGTTAAKLFLERKSVSYGWQKDYVGTTRLFVLPSTSGAARRYWNLGPWEELALWLKRNAPATQAPSGCAFFLLMAYNVSCLGTNGTARTRNPP